MKKDCENIVRSCGYSVKTFKDLVSEIKFKSEKAKSALLSYIGGAKIAYKEEIDLMGLRAAVKNVALIEDFSSSNNWDVIRNVYYTFCNGDFRIDSVAESLLQDRVQELIRDKDF
jgi:hypothetical protein